MLKTIFIFLFGLIFSSSGLAETIPANIALHIAPTHYEHPVRLLHPYLDYWHMKGPLTEKVAKAALEKRFASVTDCSGNASVVLLIEPHIFYNPQMRVFHAEFIARAYTKLSGSPITTIKKQAQQQGELAITPEISIEKAYANAMNQIVQQLETDKTFLEALNAAPISDLQSTCNSLDNMPLSKFYY